MAVETFSIDGKVCRGTSLFPFDARGQRNGKASVGADTRRLQQIQRELQQLTLDELKELRKDWSKPPLDKMAWIQALVPYLDGHIKERTPAIPLPRKQREQSESVLWLDLRKEVAELRKEVALLRGWFLTGIPPKGECPSKPLPPPRQHAKGKKRRLNGPIGELAAVTRPWLNFAVQRPGEECEVDFSYCTFHGVTLKRFQSSLSSSASYFYGRRSMHTRMIRNSAGVETGVAFTFIGSTKPIRPFNATNRTDTHPVSIDQSTPT